MKQRISNPVIPNYQPKQEKKVIEEMAFQNCCNCGCKITDGYWGHWGTGGVCSKTCNRLFEASRPKMIDYVIPKTEVT